MHLNKLMYITGNIEVEGNSNLTFINLTYKFMSYFESIN